MSGNDGFRIEKDVLGEVKVPADKYWGVNTQRAIENFKISGSVLPVEFIIPLARVKRACAMANMELGLLDQDLGNAIVKAADEIIQDGKMLDNFVVDVYQTGSGTQTNMNMNEVLANRANEILGHPMGQKKPVHPNDHVNMGQSSNDVIPTAMHVAAIQQVDRVLEPALKTLAATLRRTIERFKDVVKVGRTHLQDAVPIPLSMEFAVYHQQVCRARKRLKAAMEDLLEIPIGGTALGTGINSHVQFPEKVCKFLKEDLGYKFRPNNVLAESIASHSRLTALSGVLRDLAQSLVKMANDIRWMGSGPRAGLGELVLPANEPGSSIMPGKVNPTQSEALIQVCLRVIGNDYTISQAEIHGSILDLNVCKPLIISCLLESIRLLAGGVSSFVSNCLAGIEVNEPRIQRHLSEILMVATNLVPVLGYDEASRIAALAHERGATIKEVIEAEGITVKGDLDALLDPRKMIHPDGMKDNRK